ncbi:esterase FE4-like [Galleria mellonella]|uniref:Carboxylic ester hydrolase n=1 Tax=Galleria mellonella TaxID=7137 RepID=A0A6J1X2W7_GALME|nr:esterase FE4-like [Galleria mellonella]XP_026763519.2 esterase FE4-like [Galleria mellonella]XP_031765824.2 esterase FE4-like [Galleria mellonella]
MTTHARYRQWSLLEMVHVKWVVLWSLWAARVVRQPTATVRVSGGLLRGSIAPAGTHTEYYGVPYSIIGPEHRFKAPGPETKWQGVYEAINENIKCQQNAYIGAPFIIGKENCLILNVYTPLNTNSNSLLPVMVFIHGGGFFEGSSGPFLYGPQYIVSKGVILVTINYRLNIQGNLCLRIKEAPGNPGMKDQVAALKWVQRNIKVFGGDPDNVTLFGESAGAASVSYHVLSPMSKGLFHKAILQSGSSLSAWAYQYRPVYMASLLAKTMGYITQDPYKLYEIFSNKSDAELIVTRVPRKEGNQIISEILYTPCVEDVLEGVEPFLTELPYDALKHGRYNKVPMIIGANNEEGYLFMGMENDTSINKVTIERSLPKDMVILNERERKDVAEKLRKMYMGDDVVSRETEIKLSRFTGEVYINYPSLEETNLIANTSDKPVYSYLFSYGGWRNIAKLFSGKNISKAPGAAHADDLFYLFSQTLISSLFETEMINKMTSLWTNFAKYGNPTPPGLDTLPVRWPPVDTAAPVTLNIDSEFSIIPMWYRDSLKILKELYTMYRRRE